MSRKSEQITAESTLGKSLCSYAVSSVSSMKLRLPILLNIMALLNIITELYRKVHSLYNMTQNSQPNSGFPQCTPLILFATIFFTPKSI